MKKSNAMRLLDQAGIEYDAFEYDGVGGKIPGAEGGQNRDTGWAGVQDAGDMHGQAGILRVRDPGWQCA